jgi:hypothetical protein
MRIICGCVNSTQLIWLPTLAHIAPPKLLRKAAVVRATFGHPNTKVGVPSTYLDNGGVFNVGTIKHFWGLNRLLIGGVACEWAI